MSYSRLRNFHLPICSIEIGSQRGYAKSDLPDKGRKNEEPLLLGKFIFNVASQAFLIDINI